MEPATYYTEKELHYTEQENITRKKIAIFPFLRLASFAAAVAVFYIFFSYSIAIAIIAAVLCLVVFGIIIRRDLALQATARHYAILKEINRQELAALKNDLSAFEGGKEFMSSDHPYTSDLDIFGKASLFRYINRTVSAIGKQTLASWLTSPAQAAEIKLRQQAINELKDKTGWRQEFRANGMKQEKWQQGFEPIIEWLDEPELFLHKKALQLACTILPFITVPAVIGSFFFVPKIIPMVLVAAHIIILRQHSKKVEKSWLKTSARVELLKTYAGLIATIEKEEFNSEKLSSLKRAFVLRDKPASATLRYLSKVVDRLDLRLNVYVYPFINILLFWDIHWITKLEKWKNDHHAQVQKWFSAMAEFEALSSLGNLYYNNPDWTMPEISEDAFIVKAQTMGHPLIPANKRVYNDIGLSGRGSVMLITGSNMAGKSTYLRTVGVNIVLAMAGAPACAKNFVLSPIDVYTSMRIIDSLEENASSFYAELKRLESIIKSVKNNTRSFFLLDEILRGTNSNDRHIGSKALIKQMIRYKGTGIIATHDLELSKLENELPVQNFSFDVQVENDQLYFDYKLHHGVCRSLNASILMRKMGIEIE
jgi:DNA mismatch repair ATPase MutS